MVVWVLSSSEAIGASSDIEPFVGVYVGQQVIEPRATVEPSDLHLQIRPRDQGFLLSWQSLATAEDGDKHHHRVRFSPTRRPNIYLAVMRCDMFGNLIPLDPMQGEPYLWVRIAGNHLTLYVMYIADDGSHDLRIYRYGLEGDQISLKFERLRDNQPLRVIRGDMRKISVDTRPLDPSSGVVVKEHESPNCE
jgi:hypothetical protein